MVGERVSENTNTLNCKSTHDNSQPIFPGHLIIIVPLEPLLAVGRSNFRVTITTTVVPKDPFSTLSPRSSGLNAPI